MWLWKCSVKVVQIIWINFRLLDGLLTWWITERQELLNCLTVNKISQNQTVNKISQFAFALTGLGGRIATWRPKFSQIPSNWTTPYCFLLKITQLHPPRTWRPFNFLCERGSMREDMYIRGTETEWDFWYYFVPVIWLTSQPPCWLQKKVCR